MQNAVPQPITAKPAGDRERWQRSYARAMVDHRDPIHCVRLTDDRVEQIQTERAGCVLVMERSDASLLFGLARDRKFREVTDFGGGVSIKTDGSSFRAAIRELYEESLQTIFIDPVQRVEPTAALRSASMSWSPTQSYAVFNSRTFVMSVWLLECALSDVNESYARKLVENPMAETDAILWFTLEDLMDLCEENDTGNPSGSSPPGPACSGARSRFVPYARSMVATQMFTRIRPFVLELCRVYQNHTPTK